MIRTTQAIIVDDDEEELYKIHRDLGGLRIPAVPYLFNNKIEEDLKVLSPGVRYCFLDINLIEGSSPSSNANYSAMRSVLSGILAKDNGPYIAIAWTNDSGEFEKFKDFLMNKERMGDCPTPIAMACVSKNDVQQANNIISDLIEKNPEFNALLDWGQTVKESASRTLNSIYKISGDADVSVSDVLKSLGHSSIGYANLENNIFMGINEALIPILKDIQSRSVTYSSVWNSVISEPNKKVKDDIKSKIAPKLNAHLLYEKNENGFEHKMPSSITDIDFDFIKNAYLDTEEVICKFPFCHMLEKAFCKNRTEDKNNDDNVFDFIFKFIRKKESAKIDLKEIIKKGDINTQWQLMEISPCCDFAQNKTPKSKYMLGIKLEAEEEVLNNIVPNGNHLYQTKVVSIDTIKLSKFIFSANYVLTLDPKELKQYSCKLRAREQLFLDLQAHYANHVTRIGLICL